MSTHTIISNYTSDSRPIILYHFFNNPADEIDTTNNTINIIYHNTINFYTVTKSDTLTLVNNPEFILILGQSPTNPTTFAPNYPIRRYI